MVAAVRAGQSQRAVARAFGVSLLTVQRWLARAGDLPLEQVDWRDSSHSPHTVANKTAPSVEEQVLTRRAQLAQTSDLGEYGAQAIRRELLLRLEPTAPDEASSVPSVATINRILARHGIFDSRKRVRRPPPPPGWYLPDVAARHRELDQFDAVLGLVLEGGLDVEVLNVVSVHGGLVGSWPCESVTAEFTRTALVTHWRAWGCPHYVQFDNDTRFQGPHQFADVIGSVMRVCLSLHVTPVFAPQRETGFQAAIESYNNRWQQKVWQRFHHESLAALQAQSDKYLRAARQRTLLRQEAAPSRRAFPADWMLNLKELSQQRPQGKIIYVRRTDAQGQVSVLGHTFVVSPQWIQRLVRCDVDLDQDVIRFHALRRSTPDQQSLLQEAVYRLPSKNQAG